MDAAVARLMTLGLGASSLGTAMLVRLAEVTNHTFVLPLLIFYPTSRCNSRCVSCDWWKHSGADDLSLDEIRMLASQLPARFGGSANYAKVIGLFRPTVQPLLDGIVPASASSVKGPVTRERRPKWIPPARLPVAARL